MSGLRNHIEFLHLESSACTMRSPTCTSNILQTVSRTGSYVCPGTHQRQEVADVEVQLQLSALVLLERATLGAAGENVKAIHFTSGKANCQYAPRGWSAHSAKRRGNDSIPKDILLSRDHGTHYKLLIS